MNRPYVMGVMTAAISILLLWNERNFNALILLGIGACFVMCTLLLYPKTDDGNELVTSMVLAIIALIGVVGGIGWLLFLGVTSWSLFPRNYLGVVLGVVAMVGIIRGEALRRHAPHQTS